MVEILSLLSYGHPSPKICWEVENETGGEGKNGRTNIKNKNRLQQRKMERSVGSSKKCRWVLYGKKIIFFPKENICFD